MNDFLKRINLTFPLKEISVEVCKRYKLGEVINNRIIYVGYEDFNFVLTTSKGKFVVKVFSNFRNDEECQVLVDKAYIPYKNGFQTPKIYDINGKTLCKFELHNKKFRLCVAEYINGKDFYRLGQDPTLEDLQIIAKQVAKLNKLDLKPPFVYDKWAIVNFDNEYKQNLKLVEPEYQKIIKQIHDKFMKIDLEKLPKGFVHGDIITTNILKDKNGKLYIIDFSVGNYLPRIVDLAVCICDLCLDRDSKENTRIRTDTFINAYEEISKLAPYEKECLNIFIASHQAMTIIETTREKFIEHNNSAENDYFMQDGKSGVEFANKFKFC